MIDEVHIAPAGRRLLPLRDRQPLLLTTEPVLAAGYGRRPLEQRANVRPNVKTSRVSGNPFSKKDM